MGKDARQTAIERGRLDPDRLFAGALRHKDMGNCSAKPVPLQAFLAQLSHFA
jgi:hypothetical protein